MKLLLDQNLSRRMLADLVPAFPGSSQVQLLGLECADDKLLWHHAKDHGFMIVTLDSDFQELATLYGAPPKIVWLKCGNRPRWYVTGLLLKQRERIAAFGSDSDASVLEIYLRKPALAATVGARRIVSMMVILIRDCARNDKGTVILRAHPSLRSRSVNTRPAPAFCQLFGVEGHLTSIARRLRWWRDGVQDQNHPLRRGRLPGDNGGLRRLSRCLYRGKRWRCRIFYSTRCWPMPIVDTAPPRADEGAPVNIAIDHLTEKLAHLPPERIAEVVDFVDFIAEREHERSIVRAAQAASEARLAQLWNNAAYDRL